MANFLETLLTTEATKVKHTPSSRGGGDMETFSSYYELRTLCQLYANGGSANLLPFTTLATSHLPTSSSSLVQTYRPQMEMPECWLMIQSDIRMLDFQMGRPLSAVLGLALLEGVSNLEEAPEGLFQEKGGGNMMMDFYAMFARGGGGPGGSHKNVCGNMLDVAGAVGRNGLKSIQLFSTLVWDDEENTVTFPFCIDAFEKMNSEKWGVVLYRADSYDCMSLPTPLQQCSVIH